MIPELKDTVIILDSCEIVRYRGKIGTIREINQRMDEETHYRILFTETQSIELFYRYEFKVIQ